MLQISAFLAAQCVRSESVGIFHGLGSQGIGHNAHVVVDLRCGRDKKIGGYLGDISGAFHRVFKIYILAKLYAAGVDSRYLNFLESYLSPRKGRVVVQGSFSDEIDLEN